MIYFSQAIIDQRQLHHHVRKVADEHAQHTVFFLNSFSFHIFPPNYFFFKLQNQLIDVPTFKFLSNIYPHTKQTISY